MSADHVLGFCMGFVRYIISLITAFLFSTLGTSIAFALPQTVTDLAFTQAQTAHFSQADQIGFTARAPPSTAGNVAVTGDVTVMHGGAFVTHGAETGWASLNFGVDLVATNRTFDFASDTDGFVDDVMAFNRTTDGGGNLFSGDLHSIMQSASYYDTPAEQGASIFRSIIKNHTFENGNKRTAVAAYTAFAERVGLPVKLSHSQLMDITLRVERNELVDVSDIANALR